MRCANCGYAIELDDLGVLRAVGWTTQKREKNWSHFPCRPKQHRILSILSVVRELVEVVFE